jgi:hypothetical protein
MAKEKLKIASGVFEFKKGDWREIKPGSTYNQEYLRRIRNGIPVKTAKKKPSLKIKKTKTA